jgi:hypothetical protein
MIRKYHRLLLNLLRVASNCKAPVEVAEYDWSTGTLSSCGRIILRSFQFTLKLGFGRDATLSVCVPSF